jgi:hypothetical protein
MAGIFNVSTRKSCSGTWRRIALVSRQTALDELDRDPFTGTAMIALVIAASLQNQIKEGCRAPAEPFWLKLLRLIPEAGDSKLSDW